MHLIYDYFPYLWNSYYIVEKCLNPVESFEFVKLEKEEAASVSYSVLQLFFYLLKNEVGRYETEISLFKISPGGLFVARCFTKICNSLNIDNLSIKI